MSCKNLCSALLVVCLIRGMLAFDDLDIISDLTAPATDTTRALELKNDQFWQPVLRAANDAKTHQHTEVYAAVQAAIAAMPEENEHVRGLLTKSLERLHRADGAAYQQATSSAEVANEKLLTGTEDDIGVFSFLTAGQNFLALAVKAFVGESRYSERLERQIKRRQADILPSLRGTASAAGNILGDSREASKLAFDVLKYDIYNSGVPKTPACAKDAANKLVDAASETRHAFMQLVTGAVDSVARDVMEKGQDPSATVTRSLLSGLEDSLQNQSVENSLDHESVEDMERMPWQGQQPTGLGGGLIFSF